MKFLILLCLLALLVSVCSAHHSVRVKKPATEEDRIAHHLLHRRQPRKELKNDFSIRPPADAWKGYKSKSYHFKVGPEYPDHSRRRDYKAGRNGDEGSNIPYSSRSIAKYQKAIGKNKGRK